MGWRYTGTGGNDTIIAQGGFVSAGVLQQNIIETAPLPCDYNIPPPPSGEALDASKVNVSFTAAAGGEETFPRVDSPAACGTNTAWHYDNPASPSKVIMCPSACTKIAAGGSMNIAFGCATVVLN